MNQRSRELANELARRAIEAAERVQAAQERPDDTAQRLERAADEDGRLSVEEAVAALSDPGPLNPFASAFRAQEALKKQATEERIFGKPEQTNPTERNST